MFTNTDERLLEINRLLFCEECHRRALEFLEAAVSAVSEAGSENPKAIQTRVKTALDSFLLGHEACASCKEE